MPAAKTYDLAHRGPAARSRTAVFATGSAAAIGRTSRSPAAQAPLDALLNHGARIASQHALAGALNGGPHAVAQARFARLLSGRREGQGPIPRGAAPPVQLLKDSKSFLQGFKDHDRKPLTDIAGALEVYHKFPAEPEWSQNRLQALDRLDRLIAVAHANLPEQDGPLLLALYRESEQEHQGIVAELAKVDPSALAKNPQLLPVDLSGLKQEEVEQIQMLWLSLLSGKGNLSIRKGEDPIFVARMQAAVAKLLQGAEGRKLIASLGGKDRGEGLRVTLGSDFTKELSGTKASQGDGSEAIPLSKLAGGDNSFELRGPGKEGTVRIGDGRYNPGTGTGSYVRIVGTGAKTLPSKTQRPALTPEFITVGHELGHAGRFQTGGSIPLNAETWTNLGVEEGVERELWSTPEEYVNINLVENALRAEHLLEERKYHQSDLEKIRNAKTIVANLKRFRSAFDGLGSTAMKLLADWNWPLFDDVSDQYYKADLDWSKDQTLQTMLSNITLFHEVARVLHRLQLSGRTPKALRDTADTAGIWRRLEWDGTFVRSWRRFNDLYDDKQADAFVKQAPDLADTLAGIINRVTLDVAVEQSESSSLSLSDRWFGYL
jgi:hypothetical protein